MAKKRAVLEAIERRMSEANARISRGVKVLLEQRHLYQSVSLNFDDLLDKRRYEPGFGYKEDYDDLTEELSRRIDTDWTAKEREGVPLFQCRDVKLLCATCERVEAFNFIDAHSLLADGFRDTSQVVQVFAVSFLCQACKLIPEVFMVRRVGLKLTLCGRAPIELIEVPHSIPGRIKQFYRGGLLAFKSGQTLAGNFMLRTVIEQWARHATHSESATETDKVMDAYMKLLPDNFKAQFPSMRELYAALSSDIHGAVGSSELFERAHTEIVEHFGARRLFNIVST